MPPHAKPIRPRTMRVVPSTARFIRSPGGLLLFEIVPRRLGKISIIVIMPSIAHLTGVCHAHRQRSLKTECHEGFRRDSDFPATRKDLAAGARCGSRSSSYGG